MTYFFFYITESIKYEQQYTLLSHFDHEQHAIGSVPCRQHTPLKRKIQKCFLIKIFPRILKIKFIIDLKFGKQL